MEGPMLCKECEALTPPGHTSAATAAMMMRTSQRGWSGKAWRWIYGLISSKSEQS